MMYLAVALVLSLVSSSLTTDVFELKGGYRTPSCTGVSSEGDSTDILCILPTDNCRNKSAATIKWVFASTLSRIEILDDEKYGIWDNELGSDEQTVSSLLRVRNTDRDKDTGTYTCSLACTAEPDDVINHKIELCVKDGATNLVSCNLATTESSCTHVFGNGKCDELCNTEEQLFDGGDCNPYRDEVCAVDGCINFYNNSVCNEECASAQCGYDAGECLTRTPILTREKLSIIIPTIFNNPDDIKLLSSQISILLATLVEPYGETTPWSAIDNKDIQTTYLDPAVFVLAENNLTAVQFRLVPQSCQSIERCFLRVRSAAKYITQRLIKDKESINSSIAVIGIDGDIENCHKRQQTDVPDGGPYNENNNFTPAPTTSQTLQLEVSEIVGIALGSFSVVLLVIGLLVAYRYRTIANRNRSQHSSQSRVKVYVDSIPMDLSSESSSSEPAKSPRISIAKSVPSKDKNNTAINSHNFSTYDSIHMCTSQA